MAFLGDYPGGLIFAAGLPPRLLVMEPRRNKRKPFEYLCSLDCGEGTAPLHCWIIDISNGGARLSGLADTQHISDHVTLILSSNGGVRRDCKVAWRSIGEIGVKFLKPALPEAPGRDELVN
jgi:hypothetical protein